MLTNRSRVLFFLLYFERSFMAPLLVRFHESRWAKFLCLRDRRWVRSLSDDITGNPGVVYLQQYAKTCTCLIERTFVISLSSGCNLGTAQRYLSSYCTEAAPSLDHFFITITTVYSRPQRLLFSLAIYPMEPQDAHNSSVGHTFTPHSIYSWG